MAKKQIKNFGDLMSLADDSNGPTVLAAKMGLHALTVENWRRCGIPAKHWDKVMELLGVTERDLHVVGKACRAHTYGEKE